MFCTGAAPTVPGISARFSSAGQPVAKRAVDEVVPVSPAPASTMQASASSSTDAHAAHLDLQHDLRHVARQDDVAAAAEDELRRAAESGSSTTRRTSASLSLRTSGVRGAAGRPKVL